MDVLLQDLRYGIRRLLAQPGFTAIAVLTLALGIGANSAMFSLIRAVLLQPLPYSEPERLVMVWQPGSETDQTWLSRREVVEYRRATRSFEHLAAYTDANANLTEGAEPERVRAGLVTGNTFDALGVGALIGRTFTPEEDAPGKDDVALLGYHLWQRRFGGAPDVVGRSININGRSRTVLGVMPADFRLPLDYREELPTELWLPAAIDQADPGDWGDRSYFLFGRLRPGVSAAAASADLGLALKRWEEQGFIHNEDGRLSRAAIPLTTLLTGNLRPALLVLFGAVGFILLIACANVANLLLARSDVRRRAVATQAALGASRIRIARQLLTESAILAAVGGLLGVALAYGGVQAVLALTPINVIRMRGVSVDGGVLAFSAILALVATVLAGLAPALQLTRVDLAGVMGAGGRIGASPMRKRVRRALVIAETALSVVLVIGAGLLTRSLIELRRIDLGFETSNLLSMRLALPAATYAASELRAGFYRDLVERVEALPGVRSAAAVRLLPLTGTIGNWTITLEGKPYVPSENPNGDWQVVTPGYFETLGIKLARGRFLADADGADAPLVALIDETMAARYWPGQDALGKRFRLGTRDQPWVTIIGITRPVRHNAVVEAPRTEMFLPHAQFPRIAGSAPAGMALVVKTGSEPMGLLAAVRGQVRALDPKLPIAEVRTMDEVAAAALAQPRFMTVLLGFFAALALLLAAIGMYGVISFTAARRTHEIGIRMALGAARFSVVRLIIGEGLTLAVAGVVIGLLGAAALTRLLSTQLYGVQALDPVTFAVVPVILMVVATLAAWLPARRAARVSPLVALRRESPALHDLRSAGFARRALQTIFDPMSNARLRVVALHLLGWTTVALISASQTILTYAATGGEVLIKPVILLSIAAWYAWALLSPLILLAARKLPLYGPRWPLRALTHLAINAGLAVVAGMLYRVARVAIGIPPRGSYTVMIASQLNTALLVYWALVALSHAASFYRRARERDRSTAELGQQLAEARLEALRSQINPHFLFNTLHAIAASVRRDPRGAEDMLGELGELLRLGLHRSPSHEVALSEELQLIDRYVAIQRVRFQDRLRIVRDVEPGALAAQVPVLLLQPLVENAIEHGIAQRLSGGTLRISARVESARLILEVADDGAGGNDASLDPAHWGIGLSNTRARLDQLYGSAHTFELKRENGGVVARVGFPLRTRPVARS